MAAPRGAHRPARAADPDQDAGRADRLHRAAAHAHGAPLADLGRDRQQPRRLGPRDWPTSDRSVVVGRARLAGARPAAGPDGASPCLGARLLLRGVRPGDYPRGGRVHLRLWLAERLADECGAANLAGAAWMPTYARALGAEVGRDVDLHSIPPVTGMLSLGDGCSVEPEVDLTGHWLDGDVLHIGAVEVGAGARVGTRSTLGPGRPGRPRRGGRARVGRPRRPSRSDEFWSGSPAEPVAEARGPWSRDASDRGARRWVVAYARCRRSASRRCRSSPWRCGLARPVPALQGRARDSATRPRAPCSLLPVAAAVDPRRPRLARPGRRAAARARAATGAPPGPQPAGLAGVGDPAGPRRGAHLALPALRERAHPVVAAAARRQGRHERRGLDGPADPEADHRQRRGVPRRRHPDRQLRARRRLAARGAGQDRQAGVRRQLRDGGAPGARSPSRPWWPCCRRRPGGRRPRPAPRGSAARRRSLRRTSGDADDSRTYDPPTGCGSPAPSVEACRLVPVVVAAALGLGRRRGPRGAGRSDARGSWPPRLAGPVLMVAGLVAAATSPGGQVGCWSVGIRRPSTRCGARSCGATSWRTRSSRWWRPRGSPGPPPAPRRSTCGCAPWAPRSGRGVWCETYWLPEPDLVELRDGVTVNAGCVVQTHLFHDRVLSMDTVVLRGARRSAPTASSCPRPRSAGTLRWARCRW